MRPVALDVVRRSAKLVNREGLHARPACKMVAAANEYDADVVITVGDIQANGKSIMEVTMLASPLGTDVEIEASGPGAAEVVEALCELIGQGFGEELA